MINFARKLNVSKVAWTFLRRTLACDTSELSADNTESGIVDSVEGWIAMFIVWNF